MTQKFERIRLSESRNLIREMMNTAMGLYIAKEPKHGDEWREKGYWKNFMHLKHELDEIERSKSYDRKLHNALDACAQSAILASMILLQEKADLEKAKKHGDDKR